MADYDHREHSSQSQVSSQEAINKSGAGFIRKFGIARFLVVIVMLVLALLGFAQGCVASNLDNSFDLNNGGYFFGWFLFIEQNACRFDDGSYDECTFGF